MRACLGRQAPGGERIADDVALAAYLLRAGVAVVPGSGFGMPGFLRLSYATSDENLRIAAERMAYALGNLT